MRSLTPLVSMTMQPGMSRMQNDTVVPMPLAVSVQTTRKLQRTCYKLRKPRTYSDINGGNYAPMVPTILYATDVSQNSSHTSKAASEKKSVSHGQRTNTLPESHNVGTCSVFARVPRHRAAKTKRKSHELARLRLHLPAN